MTKAASRSVDPIRLDPTRTTMLRLRWSRDMARRFNNLKRKLVELIEREDAFGLRRNSALVIRNIEVPPLTVNQRWAFLTTPEQLEAFRQWLETQIAVEILQVVSATVGNTPERTWLAAYIEEAYRKGMSRAFDDVRKPALWTGISPTESAMDFFRGTKSEFLRQSFNRPVSIQRVRLLAARTYTDLKGVTDAMANSLGRELVDGMIQGLSPRDVARNITERVEKIGKTRALTIARTETIRAHAEGALDAMESLGVTEIGVMVEWSTAKDLKVCPLCQPLHGIVMPIKKAHGLFPRHPNCRCSPIPANVGEDTEDQIRGKTGVESAIRKSIKAENPKRSLRESLRRTRWTGADVKIPKRQPKSILD